VIRDFSLHTIHDEGTKTEKIRKEHIGKETQRRWKFSGKDERRRRWI